MTLLKFAIIKDCSGLRVKGLGYKVQGAGYRVQGTRYRVQGSGFRMIRLTLNAEL